MNKIAVIGSNGFLSNAITENFIRRGWCVDVYGLDKPVNRYYTNFVKTNLVNQLPDYSLLSGCDIIVYAAGAGIQSNLNEGMELIYNLNTFVPIKICNMLKSNDYGGIFVSFGSVFEFGESDYNEPVTEIEILKSQCLAPNEYSVSKRLLSRFIDCYSHKYTHWHFIIPTIYGVGENPKRLIPYTIYSILAGNELHFTSGNQIRQYVHVNEVPSLILKAFEVSLESGIYNIEGSETLTVKDLVQLIHQHMGKNVASDCFGSAQRTDTGMKYLALNGSKLFEGCGFKATTKIEDVIDSYISEWQQ